MIFNVCKTRLKVMRMLSIFAVKFWEDKKIYFLTGETEETLQGPLRGVLRHIVSAKTCEVRFRNNYMPNNI